MSLLRSIIRTTAVAALRDMTWAEKRVFESDNTPLAEAIYGKAPQPYIVVYTDSDDRAMQSNTPELYNGDFRLLQLVLEIGVASAVRGANNNFILQFPATDEGMEWAVDVVETQAKAALFGNPYSPWGELLKQMVRKVTRVTSRRGGQGERGIRFAARRTTFTCMTIDDIPPGMVVDTEHPAKKFIALARVDPVQGVVDTASIVEKLMETVQAPSWRIAQAFLGMSTERAKMLGPDGTPLPWPNVEQPPLDYTDGNEFVPPLEEEIILSDIVPP